MIEHHNFIGLKVSSFSREDLISYVNETIRTNDQKVCFGYSVGYFPILKNHPGLAEQCNSFDLMVTDGRTFYLFARLFGTPLRLDISIPYFSRLLMTEADSHGYSMMVIGSTPEINSLATKNLKKQYPGAIIHPGFSGGKFSLTEQEEILAHVNAYKPQILFIGTSTPIKEDFAFYNRDKLQVNLIVPFGGMIDGLAGKVKLTPPWLKKLGLAFFFRAAQEPRRLLKKIIRMQLEFFFRVLPLTILKLVILRNRNFDLVKHYHPASRSKN